MKIQESFLSFSAPLGQIAVSGSSTFISDPGNLVLLLLRIVCVICMQ